MSLDAPRALLLTFGPREIEKVRATGTPKSGTFISYFYLLMLNSFNFISGLSFTVVSNGTALYQSELISVTNTEENDASSTSWKPFHIEVEKCGGLEATITVEVWVCSARSLCLSFLIVCSY